MEQKILITDLTAMGGDRVCIAGIDREWNTIRPVFTRSSPTRRHLQRNGQVVIRPRAVVAMQLEPLANPEAPHIEDCLWTQPYSARFVKLLDDEEWRLALQGLVERCPRPLFGTELREHRGAQRRYVRPEEATFSLGTVEVDPRTCTYVFERNEYEQGKFRYRLFFRDTQDEKYEGAAVTDLALHIWARTQLRLGKTFVDISASLTRQLNEARQVYLRLGLPRPSSSYLGRCWLQVNGIYSFPDWLAAPVGCADCDKGPG